MKKTLALSVQELTKVYQDGSIFPWKKKGKAFTAVDHISFNLEEGQILGLLGQNGAGNGKGQFHFTIGGMLGEL